MKIGVLGTGFGVVHVGVFSKHPHVDEVVVFSRTQESLKPVINEYGVRGVTNMDDILTDPTIDVVTMALPPGLHTGLAVKAMEHGKDVILEVPGCTALKDAENMLAAARETGKRVMVDLFDRFTAPAKAIHRMVKSGEYGKPCHIAMHSAAGPVWGYHPVPLRALPLEMSYSDFDFLHWCFGDMQTKAACAIQRDAVSSAATVLLEGKGGFPIVLTNSSLPPKPYASQSRWEFSFERATVVYYEKAWDAEGDNRREILVYGDDSIRSIELPECNHYYDSLDYCLRKIVSGEDSITDLEQAVPALRLALDLERRIL